MKIKQLPEDFIVREIPDYEKEDGPYSVFILKKRNYTTERAIQRICEALHIKRNRVGYAGIKDKVAVTEQYISLFKISKKIVASLKLKDLELEFVSFSKNPISLGMLKENSFEIIVRDLEKDFKISDCGRIKNYFDSQRFSHNNAVVGLALLKRDFKKAVNLILETEGDYECEMKEFLKSNPNNYVGALGKIPHKILLLFIHAYQSDLFNKTIDLLDNKKNVLVPIVGFGTEYEDKKMKSIIQDFLSRDGLTERDFVIQQIKGLSSFGEQRPLYVSLKNLSVGSLKADDLNKGKYKLKVSFSLPKGSYATNVLKSLVS